METFTKTAIPIIGSLAMGIASIIAIVLAIKETVKDLNNEKKRRSRW